MDIERALLSKVVATRDLTPVSEARIGRDHFADQRSREVYDTIVRHRAEYGQTPTLEVLKLDHPDYRFLADVPEPVAWLCDELRAARSQVILEQGVAAFVHELDEGRLEQARMLLVEAIAREAREVPHGRDLDITQATGDFWTYYQELKALDGRLRGLPTGVWSLDQATQGWQPGNLCVLTGIPKSGKSTLLLNSAMACHRSGRSPVFFSYEMSAIEQQERHAAFTAGVDFERLRTGQLSRVEEKQLQRTLRQLEDMPSFWLSTDAMGTATVDALASKVEQLRPDAVYLDGVYMMDDIHGEPRMSSQALSNICQGLKQLAMNVRVPIICTTQSLESKLGKGGKITSNSVGYSSAFAQYCDALVAVEQTEEHSIQRIALVIGRNCRPFETYLEWNWSRGRFQELDRNPFESTRDEHFASAAGF